MCSEPKGKNFVKTISYQVRRRLPLILCGILVSSVLLLGGCSRIARFGHFAKKNADKEGYGIIRHKQEQAFGKGQTSDFTLEKVQDEATKRLLSEAARMDLKKDSGYTTPTVLLSLGDTLAITVANSRQYQTQKETLFGQALGLAQLRYNFGTIPTASANSDITRAETSDKVEKFGVYNYAVGLSKKMALTGALISANFAHSATRFFNVKTDATSTNNAAFSIVQPLLNGAGPLVAGEPLRQGERNLIYAVRNFQRFQQSFAIDTATQYYQLLQALDTVWNQYHNYQSALLNRQRTEMLSAAGRVGEFETDQARQTELTAQGQLNDAQTAYLNQLDTFKLSLGLPLNLDIGPDPKELKMISDKGIMMPEVTLEKAIDCALSNRLDYLTEQNKRDDAMRQTRIALRNFLPNLDAGYSYKTAQSRLNDRVDLDLTNNAQDFSLDLILPLDWTPRRNLYRSSLISEERAKRDEDQMRDQIIVEVRGLWRQLDSSRKNYEIQMQSVRLAERRVESVSLLLAAGRATTRDLLDAQNDLLSAKNSLTAALVSHTIERLQFWNAIERLKINPKGMWYEQK